MSRPSDHSLIYTLLGGIAALIIVHGIGRFAYTPILPLMREDGLTLEQGGWLAAANYVGYLLGALFTVFSHGDRIQRLRGGLLVSIATTLLMGLTHALPAWLLLRFVSGLSNGVVFVYAANLVLERLALAGRSALGGLLYSGVGAGIVLSGLLVLAVDHAGWGWQAAWWGLGADLCLAAPPRMAIAGRRAASGQRQTRARRAHPRLSAGGGRIWLRRAGLYRQHDLFAGHHPRDAGHAAVCRLELGDSRLWR
jgi:MFS family permease